MVIDDGTKFILIGPRNNFTLPIRFNERRSLIISRFKLTFLFVDGFQALSEPTTGMVVI